MAKKKGTTKDEPDVPSADEETLDRLEEWRNRFDAAEKLHKEWEDVFRCRELHAKYVGTGQWSVEEDPDTDKYYVNLFFSAVETRRPSLVFRTPFVRVRPNPSRTDDPLNTTEYRAMLFESTLNTLMGDRRVGVLPACALALQEAFFRFGCVEVGISGNVIENPRAGKPALKAESDEELMDDDDQPVLEPEFLVTDEKPFVRRIPAEQIMVSISNKNDLLANDWIGYYEYVRKEDVESNKFFAPVKDLKANSVLRDESGYVTPSASMKRALSTSMVKLIRIWDLRTHKRYVFADTGEGFLVDGESYKTLPLAFLKFHDILDSYYPLPPAYNWVHPQREVNDERESMRIHRKRFNRKYTALKGKIDPDQMDALEMGEDGTIIEVQNHDAIKPIEDAQQDRAIFQQHMMSRTDFTEVSSIGGEQRNIAESETATQANIISTDSKVRESYQRETVAAWMSEIARILLALLYEQASLPFWIYTNVDPFSAGGMQEAQEIAESFQLMRPEYLEDYANWEISVDMASMMPAVEQREKQDWMMLLQQLQPNALYLLSSDVILRKTLNYFGVKAEKEIQEIKAALQKVVTFQMNMQLMAASGMPVMPPFDGGSSKPTPTGLPAAPQGGVAAPGPVPGPPQIEQATAAMGPAPRGGF